MYRVLFWGRGILGSEGLMENETGKKWRVINVCFGRKCEGKRRER
jgi:hypothetical protein